MNQEVNVSRIGDFVMGVVCGGALTAGTMNFHVVRANDGVHLVRKLTAGINEPYVDVRNFSASDWADHKALAAAIVRSGKGDILQDSSLTGFKNSIENWLNGLENRKE